MEHDAFQGSLGVSRLDGKEDEIRHFLELGVGTPTRRCGARVWGGRGGGDPQAVRSAAASSATATAGPRYILTERGLGYRMPTPDEP